MGRFERVKEKWEQQKKIEMLSRNYAVIDHDTDWLISEIEQLKKEKDFMIQCPKCGEKITREEMDDLMVYCSAEYNTQQALKE